MKDNKFIIVILCYNCEKYIQDCVESVVTQQYDNYNVILIDDNSSDRTSDIIQGLLKKYSYITDNKFTFIKNSKRFGPLGNHINALEVKQFDDNDIIVHLDGDDILTCSTVLLTLNEAYAKNSKHLVSYGNYETATGNSSICKPWEKGILVSEYIAPIGWIFSHVRTFKYKLWTLIDKQKSFYDSNNKVFSSAGDVAIMKPILELAGRGRTMFFKNNMYFYRDNTPLNEHNDHLRDQVRCALEIKQKIPYKVIDD